MKRTFICISFVIASISAQAASFDCAKASTPIEKAICSDNQLSDLDGQLMHSYKKTLSNSANVDSTKYEQRAWLVNVRNKCQDSTCLKQAYEDRIAMLDSSAIATPSAPDDTPVVSSSANIEQSSTAQSINRGQTDASIGTEKKADIAVKAVPSEAARSSAPVDVTESANKQRSAGLETFLSIAFIVLVIALVYVRIAPRMGNWFELKKIDNIDLHGNQVHDDLMLYDTEKQLLEDTKDVLNENECPKCGNHKLKGNVTVYYGPVRLFKEIKTKNRYENELIGKKWLYYGPRVEKGEHVKCPDCKWELKNGRFEGFGEKAAVVIAAAVAAHHMLGKSRRN